CLSCAPEAEFRVVPRSTALGDRLTAAGYVVLYDSLDGESEGWERDSAYGRIGRPKGAPNSASQVSGRPSAVRVVSSNGETTARALSAERAVYGDLVQGCLEDR